MVASIKFEIPPFAEVALGLSEFAARARDWRSVWQQFLPMVASSFGETFAKQSGPLGETWPELRPDTLRRKERMGRGRSILQMTGRLASTMSQASKIKRSLSKSTLRVGPAASGGSGGGRSDLERYAAVLNYGSARRGIPARPFMGWTPEEELQLAALAEVYHSALAAEFEQKIALKAGSR